MLEMRGGGGWIHVFPSDNFCLTEPKLFVRERLSALCLRRVPVAIMFLEKRGEEYQDFPSKFFHLTMLNHFVREHSYVVFQKLSGSRKFMPKRGLSRFSVENYCVSQCQ